VELNNTVCLQDEARVGLVALCKVADLIPYGGVAVFYQHLQIAVFYLPDQDPQVYALGNFDPLSQANVLSRGIVGDVAGQRCVASPIYKQHFILATGECVEQADCWVPTYPVVLDDGYVWLLVDEMHGS